MDISKNKEIRNLQVGRVLNDAIVYERLSHGLNKLISGTFGETINAKSELYFGVDTAIQLMGYLEDKEEPYIENQLFECYEKHLKNDLSLTLENRRAARDLANKILNDWLKLVSDFAAQLN